MYPAPQRWLQQLQQDKHIDTASTQAAADAAVEQSPGPSAEGKAQQAVNNTVSTGGICGAPVLNDLRFASFTADKHPVAWRAVKEVIWCEVSILLAAQQQRSNARILNCLSMA